MNRVKHRNKKLNSRQNTKKENYVDFKKTYEDIKESSLDMVNKVAKYSPVKVSNVDETIDYEKNYIESNLNKIRNNIDFTTNLDPVPNLLKKKPEAVKRKKNDLFNFSWRLYRTVSLLLILLSFFFMKAVNDKFISNNASPYILKILNIVSVLFIINLCVFLFYITYFRYISTLKGQKGKKGPRGTRGIPGDNTMCDISKKKIATFYREKNRKPRKDKIDTSPDVVINLDKPKKKTGWWNLKEEKSKYKLIKPENSNIGFSCNEDLNPDCQKKNFISTGSTLETYITDLNTKSDEEKKNIINKNKPIIGASVNFNKLNKNIQAVMFYNDKNNTHNPEKYKYGIFGKDKKILKYLGSNSLKDISKNSIKQDFRCPPNSAIYKIEGMYDNDGLKGLKFYCQDITTGKSTKAFNAHNKKVYGVSFGVEPYPENEIFNYDKIECPFEKDGSKIKPTFISHISGSFDEKKNKIFNLGVNGCSFYKK